MVWRGKQASKQTTTLSTHKEGAGKKCQRPTQMIQQTTGKKFVAQMKRENI